MVDINLMGDDAGEKEEKRERADEFTEPSTVDTGEFSFEDKTDTFDTSKTVDYSFKSRSFASNLTTFAIFGVIILLGAAAYYFLFRGDEPTTPPQRLTQEPPQFVETDPQETEPQEDPQTARQETPPLDRQPEPEPEPQREPESRPAERRPSPTPGPTSTRSLPRGTVSTSNAALDVARGVIASTPENINLTLLSYAGRRLRLEFVAPTESRARGFVDELSRTYAGANFVVLSESRVASNGQGWQKVLLSGNVNGGAGGSVQAGAQMLDLSSCKAWFERMANTYRLQIKEFKSHNATFSEGFEKIPVFLRIYGSKASLTRFLEEMSNQSLNLEITKVLLISPDMASYSDDNLLLVLNTFLLQSG